MIFKVINDEVSQFGKKIALNIGNRNSMFKFDNSFNSALDFDIKCLNDYNTALKKGLSHTEAFASTLTNASPTAQQFAQSCDGVKASVDKYTLTQKQAELATVAQNKSVKNVRCLINTYDGGLNTLGLSQE